MGELTEFEAVWFLSDADATWTGPIETDYYESYEVIEG